MASQYFIGLAPNIAQVSTITPAGTITAGDVDTITVKDELGATIATINFTVVGTTAANVVTGLAAAWAANPITNALASTGGTGTLILTAKTAGTPFYVTSSVAGVGTLTTVATQANSSPSDINNPVNWSGGTAVANSDTVAFDNRMLVDALFGLNQSSVTPSIVHYDLGCKNIGQQRNPLKWAGVTTWDAGRNLAGIQPTQGAGRINIDHGTGAGVGVVYNTNPTPLDTGQETLRYRATNASNSLSVNGGLVGVCTNLPGDTATITNIFVTGGIVNIAAGVTATNIINEGGTVTQYCASTTSGNYSKQGSFTTVGTALVGTFNASAGNVFLNNRPSAGTCVTTLNHGGAIVDTSGNPATSTIAQWNFSGGVNGAVGKFVQAGPSQITFTATAITGWINGTFSGSQS